MGWCGYMENRACPSRTIKGHCTNTFHVCPYGPRDSKPTIEDCAENIQRERANDNPLREKQNP